jgi:hypothetical protein
VKRFQNVAARLAFALLLLAILIALVAGAGTRLGFWGAPLGEFGIFPYALCCATAAVVVGLIWIAVAFASGNGAGARYGVVAIVAAVALFWVPVRDFWLMEIVQAIPPIHDISTDTSHAPGFITVDKIAADGQPPAYDGLKRIRFEDRSYAEEALQRLYYSEIKPLGQLGTTANKLYGRALNAARAMGWRIVATVPDDHGGTIQASDTTILFGLTDDIVIRVRPSGIGARLDIRSRGREDIPDFGRNAWRIRAYLKRVASS